MNKFLLVTNQTKDPEGEYTEKARRIIEENGGTCVECLTKSRLKADTYGVIDPDSVPSDTELIISLGGDGSFLHTAKDLIDLHIPVMGINLGTLGYLTEMNFNDFNEGIQSIIQDEYQIEKRMLLKGSIIRNDNVFYEDIAVNDIVLGRMGTMSIMNFDVVVNNSFLNSYSADGYIICSPTGSTGYNLSAGGPVAHPVSEIIITTPICAHTLNSRSVVFSADALIDVIVRKKDDDEKQIKAVSFDGANDILLLDDDMIRVEKSDKVLLNLRLDRMSFVEHLGRKMR